MTSAEQVAPTYDEALEIAYRIVYELLGRRWVWPAVTTTESLELPSGQNWAILEGRPVISVDSVVRRAPGVADVDVEYVLENRRRLRFNQGTIRSARLCGPTSVVLVVTYTYGSPPPVSLQFAIESLASEIVLAYTDPDECRLPDTVTSISRQGISMQLTSAQDFLDNGRTGISELDRVLHDLNPLRSIRKARVYSVNKPPPRRTNTTQDSINSGS